MDQVDQSSWKKVFAVIWTGQFLSILSSSIVNFAIILWLSFKTGSAEVLAFAAIAAMLPQSILGLFTGVFIDRWKRKRVMILADSFIALCTLVLAVLFYLDLTQIGFVYLLLAMRSVGSAFHMPAMQASVPLLAPQSELMRIAGINQMIYSICNIAGPALGALFISWMDMTYILLLDVVGAAIACISLLFVFIPDPDNRDKEQEVHLWKESKEALAEVGRYRGLPWLFCFSIVAMIIIMPVSVLFPLMTLQHFSGNAFQVSLIEVAWGGGALLGGALLGIRMFRLNEITLINWMYILAGFTFLFSGILPVGGYVWFVVFTMLGGISGSVYNASFTTVLQTRINPAVMGRVFSFYISVSMLPSLVGLLGTGFLADWIGLGRTFAIGGVLMIVLGVFACYVPALVDLKNSFRKGN